QRWVLVWRLIVAASFLIVWHLSSGTLIDTFWISTPSVVLDRLVEWFSTGAIWVHIQATVIETIVGFLIGCFFGVTFGLVFGMNPRIAEVMEIYIVGLYSLPKVALAPLFILWLGIGIISKIALAAIGVFFLVFYNTYSGV